MKQPSGSPLRVAIIVQRYGVEINGGAEQYCRDLAERLAIRDDITRVKVFTTCARDHGTWRNHYAPGITHERGVEVERIPTRIPRLDRTRIALGWLALRGPRLRALELPWLVTQGPYAPGLPARVRAADEEFDAFLFFSYLYYPTVMGLPGVRHRAVLVPTAHDEPALRLRRALQLFGQARAIAFLTEEERALVASRVSLEGVRHEVVGCGLDMAPAVVAPERRERPYILYVGRIEAAKGVRELVAGFRELKSKHAGRTFVDNAGRTYSARDLDLVLAGRGGDSQGLEAQDIVLTGFVSDERRYALLKGCEAVVVPGHLDSLSLAMLEAWLHEKAVLVPSACPVKRGHATRAGAGGVYGPDRPLSAVLASLLADPLERTRSAGAGAAYVRTNYTWAQLEARFLGLIRFVAGERDCVVSEGCASVSSTV